MRQNPPELTTADVPMNLDMTSHRIPRPVNQV